jgi:hypothetical protein
MKYSKIIVALVILLNTVFASAVLFIFLSVGSEPVVLIGAWFAFTTGELWLIAGIKKKEAIHENKLERKTFVEEILGNGDNTSHNNFDSP